MIINPSRYAGGGGGGGLVIENYTTATAQFAAEITALDPGSIAANDLLLLIMVADQTNAAYATTPLGWLRLVDATSGSCAYTVFYKIASGTEGDVVVTVLSAEHIAWYLRVTGADTTTPINVVGVNGTGLAALSVTTDIDNCLAISMLSFDGGDGYPFTITTEGWTLEGNAQSGASGTNSSGAWGTKPIPTADATGNCFFTASSSDGTATLQFAIAPA
jgi:hypothetical protein